MRFRVKEDDLDEFDVQPSVGWYCSYTYACTIEILEIEKCGSATPTFGVYMAESNGNTILGGTVESNSHGGIHIATTCERSEEHTSELQSLMCISYAVFCLTKNKTQCN